MDFVFSNSRYLVLLFLVPLLIFLHFASIKFKRKHALRFANFDSIARIKGIDVYSKNIIVLVISCLILFFSVFSLSGASIRYQGALTDFSFVLAIDSSKSMEAIDFEPTRIDVAKNTAKDFVDSVPIGTKIGIISFSGNSVIEQRMTIDKLTAKDAIDNIKISVVGGTDIYNAVATASNLLSDEKHKAVILLSDGQTNVGTIGDAISYANKNNVLVNTIAMGTVEGSSTSYGLSKLDEESLMAIAYNTNGQYFIVQDSEKLKESFKSVLELKQGNISLDLSVYLLIAAILLFVLNYILVNTRFGVFP